MDSCERSCEPSCASETKCCLELGDELGALAVGDENGNSNINRLESDEVGLDTENIVKESVLECELANRSEDTLCDSLGENFQELVVEPLLSLDISSHASQSGKGSDIQSSSENDCFLDDEVLTLKDDVENVTDRSRSGLESLDGDFMDGIAISVEKNTEQICERLDLMTACGDGSREGRNVLGIVCVLNRIPFDEIQCKGEIDLRQCESHANLHHTKVTEVVSGTKFVGPAYDGTAMSLIVPEKSTPEIDVATHNVGQIVKNFNHEADDGNDSARTDGDMSELNCLHSSLSLRRSSRSRKTVQKGKNGIKVSKKASKLIISQTVDLLSEATRKKRSCLSRPICSSGWGLSKKFSKYFECSEEVSTKQVKVEGKPEIKAGQKSRKKNNSKMVSSSQSVEEKKTLPCRPIRLKVTFGKKEVPNAHTGFQTKIEGHISVPIPSTENKSGNVMDDLVPKVTCAFVPCSSSTSKVQFKGTKSDRCLMSGKSSHSDSFQLVEPEKLGNSYVGKFLDPGTSPDSEVIDSSGGPNLLLNNNSEKNMPGSFSVPVSLRCPSSSKSSKKYITKKDKLFGVDSSGVECQQHNSHDAEKSKKDEMRQTSHDNFCVDGANVPSENPSSNTTGSESELVMMELLSVTGKGFQKALCLENGADSNLSRKMIGIESADLGNSNHLCTPPESERKRNTKGSKMKSKLKNQLKITNAKRNQTDPSGQHKGNKKVASKREVRENVLMVEAYHDRGQPGAANLELLAAENTETSTSLAPQNLSSLALPPNLVGEQTLLPRVAWVCCDECEKWRCIPAKLADVIEETNDKWTCKDNQDQAFSDCSIPQEKSNAEINAELQISDEEDGRGGHLVSKGSGIRPPVDPQQSTWMKIKSNLFLHRRRKTQTMDEIMVCHCKPPADGTLGCGSQCLNRMLNIECVHGTCPCGDLCSNKLFQQRLYANLSWFRSGKKGYGLQVLEDISEGKFLIEYVGEVLDLQSYEARQKEYALKSHKHFYFMTLNGNEVIDACFKGNLGRFVNHSCDPNCRTEKWVVNGEICVGLFAQRNIRNGEELTFDYNYVRVFGAAAKKCYCGSLKCRGYIGGDPLNAEVVIQGDSDEEFPEPVVVDENGELDCSLEKNTIDRSHPQNVEHALKADMLHEQSLPEVIPDVSFVKAIEECSTDFISQSTNLTDLVADDEVCESSNRIAASEADTGKNEPLADVQLLRSTPYDYRTSSTSSKLDVLPIDSTASKSLPSSVDSSDKISEVVNAKGEQPLSKARPRMKISRPSKSVKNRKSAIVLTCDGKDLPTTQPLRSQVLPYKPKKLLEGSGNSHLEGVEEKLNELLDADGGICKKDASKGYLKLLLLTAASGDSGNGGAIQSNRELSMILDAFLKTKSRGVLLDIINKNGLQMLHNMLKLYKKDFKKTPTLRKLLKVLEFLAEKEILSVARIVGDSRPGVESFRESILNLTEHEDKKVHQIARNFRDRWLPRPLRNKYNVMDNNDRRREFNRSSNCNRFSGSYHPLRDHGERKSEPIENVKQSTAINNSSDIKIVEVSPQLISLQTVMNRPRKRKSRWDQPVGLASPKRRKEQRIEPYTPDKIKTTPRQDFCKTDDVMENSEDDIPPGFSCLQNDEDAPPGFPPSLPAQKLLSSDWPSVVSVGLLQQRFNPGLPVAYGIPFSVLQQFGRPESQKPNAWEIAPAFPFKPFPPLPPYPHNKKSHHLQDNTLASSSGPSLPLSQNSGSVNQDMSHHGRGSRNGPGRRYQKQMHLRSPWLRNLDSRGFKGNHSRNRVFDRSMETVAYEQNGGQHLANNVNQHVECAGNSW